MVNPGNFRFKIKKGVKYIDAESYSLEIHKGSFGLFIFAPGQGVSIEKEELPYLIMDLVTLSKMNPNEILDIVERLLDYTSNLV